ncbi:MAG: cupin-like domain-containing protein [Myxococcota bacterium]
MDGSNEATREYLGLARAAEEQSRAATVPTEIPVIDADSDVVFMQRFADLGRPVLIELPVPEHPWTLERFVAERGEQPVVVRKGEDYDAMKLAQTRAHTYLDPSRSTSFYAARNPLPPQIDQQTPRPPYLRARQHPQLMHLWIGREGTGTRLHRDLLDNFVHVLDGTKHVQLVAPHHADVLDIWQVEPALQSSRVDLDALEPDARAELGVQAVRVRPHQMLFIPCGWFHQVRNETATLAITCFLAGFPAWFRPPR